MRAAARNWRLRASGIFGPKFRLTGWRMGVFGSVIGVTLVFLINLIATVWAVIKYPVEGGIGTFFSGPCENVKAMSIWIYFGINALGTLALSSSNYTQQVLMSPTRADINKAHNQGRWLDIGVPSVRNMLAGINRRRVVWWWCLGLSSVPLHLLQVFNGSWRYNSAVFSTLSASNYAVAVTSGNILSSSSVLPVVYWDINGTYINPAQYTLLHNYTSTPLLHNYQSMLNNYTNWTKLAVPDCINTYDANFLSTNRNLIILMHSEDNINGLLSGMEITISTGEPQGWIGCPENYNSNQCYKLESVVSDIRNGGNWTIGQYGVVKECWTETIEEQCKLQFSTTILSIVIICNFVKALCMLLVFFQRDFYPLATIGDAIQSFMREPDPCTSGICYAGKPYIEGQSKLHQPWNTGRLRPLKWRQNKYRWWKVASLTKWIGSIGIISASLITTAGLLGSAVNSDRQSYGNIDIKHTWVRGFGRANLGSILPWNGTSQASLFGAVLLANTPQLLFSILYLIYNAIFTSVLMGREWNQYAYYRKPVFATVPSIGQRSTYWLHVPFQYGIPLMILSGLLHWLISQSLFLVRVESWTGRACGMLSAVGYSTISIIFVLPVATIAVIGVAICGMQRFKYDMPVSGCCSAAISAACHPPEVDNTSTLRPLMWGEVGAVDEVSVRHLSFSDGDVQAPREGISYAG
ncbi:hypothetical protein BDD12DRAFT_766134 [Trichophaea hybrida]|nr:hypothetical protein BDD12DRAFT_766134 [Trichophaea hybrida]